MIKPAQYSFVTTFSLNASQDHIREVLLDYSEWNSWWKAIRELSVAETANEKIINLKVGHLGYYLSFLMHAPLIHNERENINFTSTGDLEGNGKFVFNDNPPATKLSFYWNIQTNKKWMNVVAPYIFPFFLLSHNIVMREFAYGLAQKLNAQVLSLENSGRKLTQ